MERIQRFVGHFRSSLVSASFKEPGWTLSDVWIALAAVFVSLAAYIPTLSSSVLLEDDGLFLAAGAHLGIAHPPGYPLYTLLLGLFFK